MGIQQLSIHIKTLLDDLKSSKNYCPRNLFSGSNSSPEKSLQKNRSIFCLKNWSCDRRKMGLGISRTNADSQRNLVYNVFHRNFCCGNETILRECCTRDLDAVNLRPALKQNCGKQTPSHRKFFFRANSLYVPNIKM